jgi:hypothetical protein
MRESKTDNGREGQVWTFYIRTMQFSYIVRYQDAFVHVLKLRHHALGAQSIEVQFRSCHKTSTDYLRPFVITQNKP